MSNKEVMVVRKDILLKDNFQGFRPANVIDYERIILENFRYMKKGEAEINFEYKQPIAYTLLVNPTTKKVFAFQRAREDKHYTEKRLQGKWSIGLGGHIERVDHQERGQPQSRNPIYASQLRELLEEVIIEGKISRPKVIGYVNSDADEVSQVHFGVLYIVETDATRAILLDKEIARGDFRFVPELEKMLTTDIEVEEWSKIAINVLKSHLV